MRELTMYELDAELAEQLPARELMSANVIRGSFNHVGNGNGNDSGNGVGNHAGTGNDSGNGVGNHSGGATSVNGIVDANGNGNGDISVVQVIRY